MKQVEEAIDIHMPSLSRQDPNVFPLPAVWDVEAVAAPITERTLWSVDGEGRLVIDPEGEPMVRDASGFTVLESHAEVVESEVRTATLGTKILVYV